MAEEFEKEARNKEFEVIRFDAAFLDVKGCRACNNCFKSGEACIFKDDFNKIASEIEQADGIVLVSPVYWFTFTAQIKKVIDKLYSFCTAGKDLRNKKVALISCCEESDMKTFKGIKFAFEKSMEFLNANIVDEILIPGVDDVGEIYSTDGIKRSRELVNKF